MSQTPPVATWQALCLDASDQPRLAEFWAAALNRRPDADDPTHLRGEAEGERVWVDAVPEARTAKNRVHLDVEVGDLDGLLGLGATVLRGPDDEISWWVMADPEGGEFCAFLRLERPSLPGRLHQVVVDCADPYAQAAWWGELLGLVSEREPKEHHSALESDGRLPFDYLCFVPVPEPKSVKNRVHWDVDVADIGLLTERGATVLRPPGGDISWHVMADPEGNEFCAFTPRQ
ncbi:VOC family protein [Jiangella endophytica]|uniref:VOC family protein n=1 Tax=Jiangella endophytica TaxID=1623398 RepID=UPI0018E5A994|nr:VOC family protein [Jiangella endophytica]